MEKKKGFLEESLAESQGKDVCRALFDGSPDAIFLADPKTGLILDANPAAEELTGRPLSELIGLHQSALHPPSKDEASRRIFKDHCQRPASPAPRQEIEHELLKADGSVVPIEITSKILKIRGRKVLQGFFHDISARKLALDALRESEERYRTLVDRAQVGIVVQKKGVVKFANKAMAQIVKLADPALLIGRNALDFMHPDSLKAAKPRTNLGEVRLHPPAEEKLLAADGSVVEAEVLTVPINYQGETCTLGMVVDITDRKLAELHLLIAHRKLMASNTELERRVSRRTSQLEELNKELEAFSYSAAHDLKAPLRRINIFSDMLEKEAGPSLEGANHDYLVNIHKSVTQMTELVNGLLCLSTTGRKPLSFETVQLSKLLAEAVNDIKAENPYQDIEWTLPELPTVTCDKPMLRQVLVNLVDNAVKYSRGSKPAKVEVFYVQKDREHVIGVRDNGVGFRMENADKLFGVFQRLHRSDDFEGTGIGLSIVKRIISRHGGRVWAESEPGKGAVFCFSLPTR